MATLGWKKGRGEDRFREPGGPDAEESAADVDRLTLSRIAAATKGSMIDPAQPETWPAPEEPVLPAVRQGRTLVLCGLLGVDWLVRLFKGLV